MYQERRFGLRLGLALALVGCSYDVTLGNNSLGLGDQANLDAPVAPGDPGTVDVTVDVRSDTARHAISPLIYGIRYNTDFAANCQTLYSVSEVRWSTYNWETNASNSAYLTNQNDDYLSNSDEPGQAVKSRLEDPVARGVAVLLVLPIGGRVSADKFANGDVRDSGSDYLANRFKQNAPQKTGPLSVNPDLGDGLVYQDEFVSWVRSQYPSAQVLFAMDEEPDLWTTTMPAARPEALTYAELVQRNVDSAAAVKRVWPAAEVLGLTSYGWSGWEFLIDPVTQQPPLDAPGEFIDYYLAQLRSAEQSQGKRLIDYLDLHWWSEARGDNQRVTEVEDATARFGPDPGPAFALGSELHGRQLDHPDALPHVERSAARSDSAHPAHPRQDRPELSGHQARARLVALRRQQRHQRCHRRGRHLGHPGPRGRGGRGLGPGARTLQPRGLPRLHQLRRAGQPLRRHQHLGPGRGGRRGRGERLRQRGRAESLARGPGLDQQARGRDRGGPPARLTRPSSARPMSGSSARPAPASATRASCTPRPATPSPTRCRHSR